MILTGKAAEFAEEFEKIDREILARGNIKIPELTEGEQKDLFTITMMFERDEAFKSYMRGCLSLYASAAGKKELPKLMILMKGVSECLLQS